jgi:hypothetical protein
MGWKLSRALAPLALMLMVWWPSSLSAAPSDGAEAQLATEVDDLVERGIGFRRAGEDASALAVFLRAEQLEPRAARIRVHLAAVYQALGRWEDADRYLVLALEDPSDPYIIKHQAILAGARRTIDAHLASLDVTGSPSGATVSLNGRSRGVLPLPRPLRVAAGIYTLEVKLDGYYSVVRSVALPGGELLREEVSLTRGSPSVRAPKAPRLLPPVAGDASTRRWLPWTFAGLAVAAAGGATVALVARERRVDRYNDDSVCLPIDGRTRGETCDAERRAGDRAETWMWIGAATAGAFAMASAMTLWLLAPDSAHQEQPTAAATCGVGLMLVQCSGRF